MTVLLEMNKIKVMKIMNLLNLTKELIDAKLSGSFHWPM